MPVSSCACTNGITGFGSNFSKKIAQLYFGYIAGAVRRNRKFKDATVAEMECVIKQWLQCPCDRKGGFPRKTGKDRHAVRAMRRALRDDEDEYENDI